MAAFPARQSKEHPAEVAMLCSGPGVGDLLGNQEDGWRVAAQHSSLAFRLPYRKVKAKGCS